MKYTPNLNLFEYEDTVEDGNEKFLIQRSLNDNWDKLDAAWGSLLGEVNTSVGGELAALKARLNTLEKRVYLKDQWISGSNGYRLYSDGWIDQWGMIIVNGGSASNLITLHKEMASTDYNIMAIGSDSHNGYPGNSGSIINGTETGWGRVTTKSFMVGLNKGYGGKQAVTWRVCGRARVVAG